MHSHVCPLARIGPLCIGDCALTGPLHSISALLRCSRAAPSLVSFSLSRLPTFPFGLLCCSELRTDCAPRASGWEHSANQISPLHWLLLALISFSVRYSRTLSRTNRKLAWLDTTHPFLFPFPAVQCQLPAIPTCARQYSFHPPTRCTSTSIINVISSRSYPHSLRLVSTSAAAVSVQFATRPTLHTDRPVVLARCACINKTCLHLQVPLFPPLSLSLTFLRAIRNEAATPCGWLRFCVDRTGYLQTNARRMNTAACSIPWRPRSPNTESAFSPLLLQAMPSKSLPP